MSVCGETLRRVPLPTEKRRPPLKDQRSKGEGFASARREPDESNRLPGVSPIPSTQLPIPTGVSAPTAAGGGGPLCGPRLLRTQSEICKLKSISFAKQALGMYAALTI